MSTGVSEIPTAILIDAILQAFTLGVILCQAVNYYTVYGDDSRRMRIYVGFVVLLAVLQSILEEYKVWRVTIFRKTWDTSPIEWSDIFLNGCIGFVCEAFLIRRCWKITNKNYWVLIPLATLSTTILVANIYLAVELPRVLNTIPTNEEQLRASRYLASSTLLAYSYWTFGSLALDATVTLILMVFLWRSRTGLEHSNRVIWKVIALTWESALLPSVSMIVAVSLFHSTPYARDHLVLFFILITGKLYTLGLLRTINSRAKLRERMKSHELGRTNLDNWQWDEATEIPPAGRISEAAALMNSVTPLSPTSHEATSKRSESSSISSGATRIVDIAAQFESPSMDARERGVSVKRRVSVSNT